MSHLHDFAILGATAAGYAAAYHLARRGASVVLVAAPSPPVECPLIDWVPANFFGLSGLPRSLQKKSQAGDFRNVRYHNATLDKQMDYVSRARSGFFVRREVLDKTFRTLAGQAKVKFRSLEGDYAIDLDEDEVRLGGPRPIAAKFLLIAHSRPDNVLSDLALPVRSVPQSQLIVAGLDVPVKVPRDELNDLLHVVEMHERSELGVFFRLGDTLHIRVISSSAASGNRALELSRLVSALQSAELLPKQLSLAKARGAVWYPPAGVALEMETHVAKRCLLVGTAGGFSEAITGQTLYPSVSSAILAADIARAAIDSDEPQNTLMQYKNIWREQLAETLRPPNTSLRLLLPLLFVNKNIVPKFTRALLYGENI